MPRDHAVVHLPPSLAVALEWYGRSAALRALEDMDERDADILRKRFFREPPRTLKDLAREHGLHRSHVCEEQNKAAERLLERLLSEGGERYVSPREREPIDWDEAAELYREDGWTMREIAERYGWCVDLVSRGFRERGIRRASTKPLRSTAKGKKLYALWMYMHQRCSNPSCTTYERFGGRGVRVCAEWEDFPTFHDWACEAGYRPGRTLVLVDSDGDFEPGNCRFGTLSEARRALGVSMPPRRMMTAYGETKSITEWFEDPRCVVRNACVYERLKRGWPFLQAIATPPGGPRPPGRPSLKNDTLLRPSRVDWDEAVRLRRELDFSDAEIAERLGCATFTIAVGLRERGVRKLKRSRERRNKKTEAALRGVWKRMLARGADHEDVSACAAWRESYETFRAWSLENGWKPGRCLVRVHDGRGFSPGDCRWAGPREVKRYATRPRKEPAGRAVTAFGETKSIAQWARDPRCRVAAPTLGWRLEQGLDPEEAVTTPPRIAAGEEIEAFGERKIVAEWARDRRCRVALPTIYGRLARGWEPERAIAEPPGS